MSAKMGLMDCTWQVTLSIDLEITKCVKQPHKTYFIVQKRARRMIGL